jgi:glutaredoxin
MGVLPPPKCPFKKKDKWTDGRKRLKIKVCSDTTAGIYYLDYF